MKAKVLIPFRDKNSMKAYDRGDIVDVTLERFNEINAIGNIIQVVDAEDEKPSDETGGNIDEYEYQ